MRIQTNTLAMRATNIVAANSETLGRSLERLSSGLRINRGADDAAGLVISQKLRAEISGLKVATRNTQDAISVLTVADSYAEAFERILQRRNELAIQYANSGALDSNAQTAIEDEWDSLIEQWAGLGSQEARWPAKGGASGLLLGGTYVGTFQIGTTADDILTVDLSGATNAALFGKITNGIFDDPSTQAWAQPGSSNIIDRNQVAIDGMNLMRANFGALQNRAEATLNSLRNAIENLTNSESRIRDADLADEMVEFSRRRILVDAGTAMVAQAAQLPRTVLSLLT